MGGGGRITFLDILLVIFSPAEIGRFLTASLTKIHSYESKMSAITKKKVISSKNKVLNEKEKIFFKTN